MTGESREYLEINRKAWDQRTALHLGSSFYDTESFLAGRCTLDAVDLELLGELSGRSVLHLQCHFGQDTLSLARAGARVVGVDFSERAVEAARELAVRIGQAEARFVCCDVYSLPEHLEGRFDVVYTSYGVLGWLPDMARWARVVEHFLAPGGRLVLVEFHPVLWMFDDRFREVRHSYFNTGPIHESEAGSYAERSAPVVLESVGWNHGLGEVLGAVLASGLGIVRFEEHDASPHACFEDAVEVAPGRYRIGHMDAKLPMVYALVAEKRRDA